MCCNSFWKKIVPFAMTFTLGILLASLFQTNNGNRTVLKSDDSKINSDSKISVTSSARETRDGIATVSESNGVFLTSKPRPIYTSAARENDIQGTVRLRVTFLASGEIGSVTPLSELPYGLTEEAIKAAKSIEFRPAIVDGKNVSVSKIVEYSFTIY